MEPIRLTGHVNENGQLEIHQTEKLPPGDVVILVEPLSAEVVADEAQWDEQFAHSQDLLEAMGREALAEYEAGLTEDFDPDVDPL